MRVAVTSSGKDLNAPVDPRFGRAAYFIIVDPDTMAFEAIENTQNMGLPQGAGVQAGKVIVENGVDVVLTGNCGPKAFKVLESAGVRVLTNASGSVKDMINQFKNGELGEYAKNPNVDGHWI
ncbi:MAG: NifB/NifX family molybdenum-iron cluster-binding protein [Desulfobacterales bacterium]|nr:NifB/NifX family molybdenum-iron cluster-binding protein [Desulfobacterales bacterium]